MAWTSPLILRLCLTAWQVTAVLVVKALYAIQFKGLAALVWLVAFMAVAGLVAVAAAVLQAILQRISVYLVMVGLLPM
jgi:hypothetical protein